MIERIISKKDAGQRLNKYAMKYLNLAPSSFIYKMLRKKNITLNGKKASGDEILQYGDSLKFFLSDETIGKFRQEKISPCQGQKLSSKSPDNRFNTGELKVLYQDLDILAVHKPAGILSQKAKSDDRSMNEMIVDYCLTKGLVTEEEFKTFTPSVCNRLDRNTSGILLAGITLSGSQKLSQALRNRDYHKYYTTLVKGTLRKTIHQTAYIKKENERNISTVVLDAGGNYDMIETAFEPLEYKHGYTMVRVTLYTGKSHQIRAHLKTLGYPVLGDTKYGDPTVNRNLRERFQLRHHLLHAGEVHLNNGVVIRDELPEYFIRIWSNL